jgi:hypothetical protein
MTLFSQSHSQSVTVSFLGTGYQILLPSTKPFSGYPVANVFTKAAASVDPSDNGRLPGCALERSTQKDVGIDNEPHSGPD